jgi:hypothetical protein
MRKQYRHTHCVVGGEEGKRITTPPSFRNRGRHDSQTRVFIGAKTQQKCTYAEAAAVHA